MADFDGAKIAILRGEDVLTLLRDNRADLQYSNQWDLPGGGREDDETPIETVARELFEELHIVLDSTKIIYEVRETVETPHGAAVYFFVARWDGLADDDIALGDEGQRWCWMPVSDFVSRKDVVAPLRGRLSRALRQIKA